MFLQVVDVLLDFRFVAYEAHQTGTVAELEDEDADEFLQRKLDELLQVFLLLFGYQCPLEGEPLVECGACLAHLGRPRGPYFVVHEDQALPETRGQY